MHLVALLVALICDSEVSATPFDINEFRERWEEPCVARLRDYQDSGIISLSISEEIDAFCEFMNSAAMILPTCTAEEAERIANMCWAAMNEVCPSLSRLTQIFTHTLKKNNLHKLYLPLPGQEMQLYVEHSHYSIIPC